MQSIHSKKCGALTRSGKPCESRPMPNGRCRMHGGSSPSGIASATFKTGIHSKDLPTRLLKRYSDALANEAFLSLQSDIALLDVRIGELLQRLDTGETGAVWKELKEAWRSVEQVMWDPSLLAVALSQVGALIDRGFGDQVAWGEVVVLLERRRKLVATEQKKMVADQQMITVENALVMVQLIIQSIKRNVTDNKALAAISADVRRVIGSPKDQGALAEVRVIE
ncbi:MAG TPA: HGGxSTG domain-containing protein [Chloroflexia bacterium]